MAKKDNPFQTRKVPWKKDLKMNWGVYLMFIPIFLYTLVLHYIPMFGIVMAFEDYDINKGYFKSPWVGMANFVELFSGSDFPRAIFNTVVIALLKCTVGFVMPILFACLLSLLRSKKYKRTVQTSSYLPNFVAAVIVCFLVQEFVKQDRPITLLLHHLFGLENTNLLADPNPPAFWIIYLVMGIWQGIGWGSIMYVAAIATVSGDLHEAAAIDGATRLQRLTKITLPCIMPTIVMMFVLGIGTSFAAGYDNILLLYMPTTYPVADTIYTYTYRLAVAAGGARDYSLSAASGLFQSIVGTILLMGSNYMSKKASGSSLF
nr:ABC transporter permease subunit [uncultured Acetatifactor sp.]